MFSTEIFIPVVIMSILGGAFALLIGVVSQLTHIDVDPRVIQIREALPMAALWPLPRERLQLVPAW